MKILYYDCFAGISGDMNLGALLDLGVEEDSLREGLKEFDIGPYEIRIRKDQRRGITGTKVDVIVPGHDRPARSFRDIAEMIGRSGLSKDVKRVSLDIFAKIAAAEGKVHGRAMEDVHFHEIGAVDSVIDIVGAAVCLESLGVETVLSSPVQVGSGFVQCAHGVLPVPAPATAEILRGIPTKSGRVPFEATTPTGAAILASTVDLFTEVFDFTPARIGYGIGHRDTADIPNVLRVYLGDLPGGADGVDDVERGEAVVLECNIDDMNPEQYDFILEMLFEKGAQDVFLTPIIMKKSRPAVKISVLCDPSRQGDCEEILWRHSSTFGLRSARVTKAMLKRKLVRMKTEFGEISLKSGYFRGCRIKSKPEYEDCRKLAKEKGITLEEIMSGLRAAERLKR